MFVISFDLLATILSKSKSSVSVPIVTDAKFESH